MIQEMMCGGGRPPVWRFLASCAVLAVGVLAVTGVQAAFKLPQGKVDASAGVPVVDSSAGPALLVLSGNPADLTRVRGSRLPGRRNNPFESEPSVQGSGALAKGLFQVRGKVRGSGTDALLLSGSLVDFSSSFNPLDSNGLFELLADVGTGGQLSPAFGGQVGVLMSLSGLDGTNFLSAFNTGSRGLADSTAAVGVTGIPEPSTLFLFLGPAAFALRALRVRAA